ncbi:hypothetical protein Taro_051970 [Colocasia esculenta]|uniref:Uncharacterized protein n=1 Tax=Colocasia esculenta TaxID=4460 RepID=A0A843XIG0_COLES|nr:hypothetical protein [Colocasia esculenta]
MASTQLASPEYETRPTRLFVGLEADDVNTTGVPRRRNQADEVLKLMASTQLASPEYEARPPEFSVGLEAGGVNTTGVT